MAETQLTADDLQSERDLAVARVTAFETLQRLYPDHTVAIVLSPRIPVSQPQSIRDKVAEAARDGWVTVEDIMLATGLKKDQVYGVLTAPGSKECYDRQLAPNEPAHGRKHYRLKAETGMYTINGGSAM